ncbi:TlyA family RNA methyltransferase [Mycoplasma phocimorsus]|uniref:TlyA family RNA methyltransferase n=1 Tax=Mycoplasma phocimorsus TaxID=3045839 RepID=UPI0024C010FC|nr:TlyA family RNA methyltransferase [Mycoplasma phocimorsus]MDJ1648975.1 TlyA family RNA methyltransferase [Mycoplasma phocimorsus]
MRKVKLIDLVNKKINNYELCQKLIRSGKVLVNYETILLPNILVDQEANIQINYEEEYVSRGAYKLKHAIEYWKLDFKDKNIVDIGSSTGGFTQISLLNDAKLVYCIDSGTNQLDFSLRRDERTIVYEKTNLKLINKEMISEDIDFVVCDVSFISLKEVFKAVLRLKGNIKLILLIKPQFEAPRIYVQKKGIVEERHHEEIIQMVKNYDPINYKFIDLVKSPITGKKSNNIEYLAYFERNNYEY